MCVGVGVGGSCIQRVTCLVPFQLFLSLSLSLSLSLQLLLSQSLSLSSAAALSRVCVRALSHAHQHTAVTTLACSVALALFPQVTSSRASASTPTCIHPLNTSDTPQAYQIRHDGKVLWVGSEDGDADGGGAVADGREMRGACGPGHGEEAVVVSNFDREQRLVGQFVSVSAYVSVSVS